jgi:hypothetical protein
VKYQVTAYDMRTLFALCGLFLVCALLRIFIVRKIVLVAGRTWDLNSPFQRGRVERESIKALQPSALKTQYRAVTAVGVGAWLSMAAWMIFRELGSK